MKRQYLNNIPGGLQVEARHVHIYLPIYTPTEAECISHSGL